MSVLDRWQTVIRSATDSVMHSALLTRPTSGLSPIQSCPVKGEGTLPTFSTSLAPAFTVFYSLAHRSVGIFQGSVGSLF